MERIHLFPAAMAGYVEPELRLLLPDAEIITLADEEALAANIDDVEVLLAWTIPGGHLGRARRLRLIQAPGAGVDRILADPALAPDVQVCNASGAHEPHMPEFVLTLLLSIAKKIPRLVDQQREHRWRVVAPRPLAGMRACIVGLGTIGVSVATRLQALGIEVVGVRHSGRPVAGIAEVYTPAQRMLALRGADLAIVIIPKTAETAGLIGASELSVMNPHGFLVDVSRGGVTDPQAVVDALAAGRLEAAAMDVFVDEPLPSDSRLWDVPGLLVTPHTAGYSPDYAEGLAEIFVDNLRALRAGGAFRTPVDRERGY